MSVYMTEWNEYRKDIVQERLPEGWNVLCMDDEETLAKGHSRLSFKDADELQSKAYDLGYKAALEHIRNITISEQYDV